LKLFGKNRLKTFWSFSQTGSLWRFIFGGDKYIVGETRDKESKKLHLFVIEIATGKEILKNFSFEDNNFWITVEGATSEVFYLSRFEKPETLYQKSIIAINITSGEKLWENDKYSFLFNTNDALYGILRRFEDNEIVEIGIQTGELKKIFKPEEHIEVFRIRNSNEDYIYENSNYPVVYNKDEAAEDVTDVLNNICFRNNDIETVEYIQKGSLLIFNYYIKLIIEGKNAVTNDYENRFIVYDTKSAEVLFEDILNKSTSYCVPDNFFLNKEYLFYLKEKSKLNCIKLF
jgi:hypothetical protein